MASTKRLDLVVIHSMSKKLPKERAQDRHKPHRMFRLSEELGERLEALAAKNHRPMAWEIRLAVEAWIEKHNQEAKPGDRV